MSVLLMALAFTVGGFGLLIVAGAATFVARTPSHYIDDSEQECPQCPPVDYREPVHLD